MMSNSTYISTQQKKKEKNEKNIVLIFSDDRQIMIKCRSHKSSINVKECEQMRLIPTQVILQSNLSQALQETLCSIPAQQIKTNTAKQLLCRHKMHTKAEKAPFEWSSYKQAFGNGSKKVFCVFFCPKRLEILWEHLRNFESILHQNKNVYFQRITQLKTNKTTLIYA